MVALAEAVQNGGVFAYISILLFVLTMPCAVGVAFASGRLRQVLIGLTFFLSLSAIVNVMLYGFMQRQYAERAVNHGMSGALLSEVDEEIASGVTLMGPLALVPLAVVCGGWLVQRGRDSQALHNL